ncbi:hypothetical protein H8959_007874 [Pygathrix nigripes]
MVLPPRAPNKLPRRVNAAPRIGWGLAALFQAWSGLPHMGALNAGPFPSELEQPGVQAWPPPNNFKCPVFRQIQNAVYAYQRQIFEPAAAPFLLKSH